MKQLEEDMRQLIGVLFTISMLTAAAQARILHVNPLSNNLQAAFDSSFHGDTVLVQPGHYHGHFQVPAHDILLASRYLFDPDTSFIVNTILDGDLTGTVLTVPEGEHWFRLNGMTITGGMAESTNLGSTGGGIWVRNSSKLDVRNSVLTGNSKIQGDNLGSAICGGLWYDGVWENVGDVILDNIQLTNNGHVGTSRLPVNSSVFLGSIGSVHATRILCNGAGLDDAALSIRAQDSLVVRDLRITGYRSRIYDSNYILCALNGETITDISDVIIWDNLSSGGTSFQLWGSNYLGLRNLSVFENADSAACMPNSTCQPSSFVNIYVDSCNVDSLRIRDNFRVGTSLLQFQTDRGGRIRNLEVTDNQVGVEDQWTDAFQQFMYLRNIGLENGEFLRNTMELPVASDPGGYGGPSMVECTNLAEENGPDTLIWRNVRFQDNQVIEHTPAWDKRRGLVGRTLEMTGLRYGHMLFQDCKWIGNHTNLIAPEVDNWMDYRNVGSTVEIAGIYPSNSELVMENSLFQDNDDGGLWANEFGRGRVSNCRFIDNDRYALMFHSGSDASDIEIENVYISGTNAQLAFLPYSQYQGVLSLASHSGLVLKNTTITNCNTPFVCFLGDMDWHVEGHVVNSSFSDLQYDEFMSTGEPLEQTWPGNFQYCMSEAMLPGVHNLVDSPAFDNTLGAPFLSLDSPCIDAGDPDPAYNDVEDPESPGFPFWPALGNLRNDMGFTGGPHAVALDTSDVTVPDWHPFTQPNGFTLGAPWPNPFNPSTWIPFTLTRPEIVKLSVHNVLGQEVAVLVNGLRRAGRHEVVLDGAGLASGLYFITLQVDARRETRAVTLLR